MDLMFQYLLLSSMRKEKERARVAEIEREAEIELERIELEDKISSLEDNIADLEDRIYELENEIMELEDEAEIETCSAGDKVKEKYAVASPDLQIEVKMLFDERKKLLDLILSKECNYITSENSISIDDKDIESKDAMKRIHQIEKEVCDLLRVKP